MSEQAASFSEMPFFSPEQLAECEAMMEVDFYRYLEPVLRSRDKPFDQATAIAPRPSDAAVAHALTSERAFIRGVSTTIGQALSHEQTAQTLLMLFDLDETLLKHVISPDASETFAVVRPSAVPLMTMLRAADPRIVLGILSSREILDFAATTQPFALAQSAMQQFDPRYLISSAALEDDLLKNSEKYRAMVTPYNAALGASRFTSIQMPAKLALCSELLMQDPSLAIVLADDQKDLASVHTGAQIGSRLWPVALSAEGAFLPRTIYAPKGWSHPLLRPGPLNRRAY